VIGPIEIATGIAIGEQQNPGISIVGRKNGRGSAILAGAPACLLVTANAIDGYTATIPAANNLRFFEGIWLPMPDGSTSIPNGAWGRVLQSGLAVNQATGTGLARVMGASTGGEGGAGISTAGKMLMYTATNDYFEIYNDLYTGLEEQVSRILSGEACTTASVALKKVWLK
jgi:hypothetical protein